MITKYGFSFVTLLALFLAIPARATNYTLTVTIQGSGTIATNPAFTSYHADVTVGLTATPSVGSYFAGWSGDASGTTNEVNVYMSDNMSVTALFLPYPIYTLTLTTNGQGAIGLNPAGGSYYNGTVVGATATPAPGWVFTGWAGAVNGSLATVSLEMYTNLGLTANFAQLPAFDVEPQAVTNAVGSTVSFSSHSVGSAPLAYQWYFSNEPVADATNGTLTLAAATATKAGFYEVTATNLYGSATSSVAALVLTNASGPTNVVSVCDQEGLQAAISAGGWISLGCSGTITLTNTLNINNQVILDGSRVSAIISGGNMVSLFNVAPGASLSITNLILANGSSLITSGSATAVGGAIYNDAGTVILTRCTLTNNSAVSTTSGSCLGGAIFNSGGTVQIYESIIWGNQANNQTQGRNQPGTYGMGGAIFSTSGTVILVDDLLQSNSCSCLGQLGGGEFGGALYQDSGVSFITNCNFSKNLTYGGAAPSDEYGNSDPAYGGALAVAGGTVAMDLRQCTGNTAHGCDGGGEDTHSAPGSGGAVYCAGTLQAVRCSFSGNQSVAGGFSIAPGATAYGGAIYNLGTTVLRNCLVCSNATLGGTCYGYELEVANGGNAVGGGIYNDGQILATNCTIALNATIGSSGFSYLYEPYPQSANGNALGGGLYNDSAATFLGLNTTIASNICNAMINSSYSNGFAAGVQIANTNGTVQLRNSLLAYGSTNGNAYGTITDLGDNISSDATAAFASGSSYNNTDPLLGPLANHGGPTLTMALNADSPAIGYADSVTAPPDDQRGYARPAGVGVIDLGAYQYGATQIYYPPTALSLSIAEAFPNVLVSFTTSPQITNTIHFQSSTNLLNWLDLQTIGASATPTNISETISLHGAPQQFFRLMW